jgi:hypothetical protein
MWMRSGAVPAPAAAGPAGAAARPAMAGGSPEADVIEPPAPRGRHLEVALVAVLGAGGSIFFGIIPQPVFDLVRGVGGALAGLL